MSELTYQEQLKPKYIIKCKDVEIGGDQLAIIAGPCSVENETQIHRIAKEVSQTGAKLLRGGAHKPRTSPYSFQGLGNKGYDFLAEAAKENGLLSVSEVMDEWQIDYAEGKIDILQIGSRNMQNFSLLKLLGKTKSPILLKRGYAATYQEFLLAAEYILDAGNPNVILCERGIRTFEPMTRFTLDLNLVPMMRYLTHLPVIVDPSHGTGIRKLVTTMATAAIAAGASGLEVEVHHTPAKSITDASQAISIDEFKTAVPLWNAISRCRSQYHNAEKKSSEQALETV